MSVLVPDVTLDVVSEPVSWSTRMARTGPETLAEKGFCDLKVGPRAESLRYFDPVLGVWTKPAPVEMPARGRPAAETVLPRSDGSGVRWGVFDRRSGVKLWEYEAIDFNGALAEKQRLCDGVGARSGWAYLRRL